MSYSGFGEVDLAEAVARTTGGAILTILPGGRGRGSGGGSGAADTDSEGGSAGGRHSDEVADGESDEVPSAEDLGIDHEKVNVNGGAIALGHPIGMSGARIVLHLALELKRRGGGVGAAALCGGGGQGDARIVRVPRK